MNLIKGCCSWKVYQIWKGYCQSFLSCLSCQGGPPHVGAQKLAKEWSERVHQELNIYLSFNVVMSDTVVTSQIPSSKSLYIIFTSIK